MERQVIARDYQETTAADLNNMQAYAQQAIDRLIADAIADGIWFTGFDHQETGTWELTLSPGRMIEDGRMYRRDTASVLNFYNIRPLVQKKIVAVTAWGQTIETDIQPRDFLINVDTGTAQPDSVAMERLRSAEVSSVAGAEAPQPTAPNIAANNALVALVTLGTGGIEAVRRIEENVLPQVLRNLIALNEISVWRGGVGAAIDTIRSDLSSLAVRFGDYVSRNEYDALRDSLASTRAVAEQALALIRNATPPTIYQFMDAFDNAAQSNPAAAGYAALIEDGVLTFPLAVNDQPVGGLALVNANDPKVKVVGNMMTPALADQVRIDTTAGLSVGHADMLAYATATHDLKIVRPKNVCFEAGKSGRLVRQVIGLAGAGFSANRFGPDRVPPTVRIGNKAYTLRNWAETVAGNGIWNLSYFPDSVDDRHDVVDYEIVEVTNHTGQGRAFTFLNANPGFLTKVELEIVNVANAGDIRAVLLECDGDEPDLMSCLASVTVAYGDLRAGLNTFAFQPAYLRPGQRYAIVFMSQGNHRLRLRGETRQISKGCTFALYSANKWIIPGEIASLDLSVKVYFGTYPSTRVEVDLQPLELAGGIGDIRIDTPIVAPPGTSVRFEGYVDGNWYSLAQTGGSLPAYDWSALDRTVIQLRAVFIGTGDLMPSVGIGALSTLRVSRAAAALKHVSAQRDTGVGHTVTKAQVTATVENWDAANTLTLSLLVAGAPVAAASVQDRTVMGRLVRTANFTFAANRYFTPVIEATRNAAKPPMFITERTEAAS